MRRYTRGLLLALALLGGLSGCRQDAKVAEEPQVPVVSEAPPVETATPATTPPPVVRTAAPPAPSTAQQNVRIVAWNLEWFPGHKPEPTPQAEKQQMDAAKSALAQLKPDVLLLEEVRDWTSAEELCKA